MATKRLDLFLLAGCSCLLTLLAQPIATAIATPAPAPTTTLITAVQVSETFCPIDSRVRFDRAVNH